MGLPPPTSARADRRPHRGRARRRDRRRHHRGPAGARDQPAAGLLPAAGRRRGRPARATTTRPPPASGRAWPPYWTCRSATWWWPPRPGRTPSRPPASSPIAGHLAFYPQRVDECSVDGEVVQPNEGGFYGGWVTSTVVGPFKGGAGSGAGEQAVRIRALSVFEGVVYHCWSLDRSNPCRPTLEVEAAPARGRRRRRTAAPVGRRLHRDGRRARRSSGPASPGCADRPHRRPPRGGPPRLPPLGPGRPGRLSPLHRQRPTPGGRRHPCPSRSCCLSCRR